MTALRARSQSGALEFSNLQNGMVARDGIEPPTPAFSGPRSTTELPGLSRGVKLHVFCADSGWAGKMGETPCRAMQQTLIQYNNPKCDEGRLSRVL